MINTHDSLCTRRLLVPGSRILPVRVVEYTGVENQTKMYVYTLWDVGMAGNGENLDCKKWTGEITSHAIHVRS
eukprot:COSAG02_NODE_511_length_20858_cov_21.570837_1_plen_73_part_00